MDNVWYTEETLESRESFEKEKLLICKPRNGRSKLISYA